MPGGQEIPQGRAKAALLLGVGSAGLCLEALVCPLMLFLEPVLLTYIRLVLHLQPGVPGDTEALGSCLSTAMPSLLRADSDLAPSCPP